MPQERFAVSERCVFRVVGQPRAVQRYVPMVRRAIGIFALAIAIDEKLFSWSLPAPAKPRPSVTR